MTEITEIYKGYLDLIEYLEEKFPGGVNPQCNHPYELMFIKPTTNTTTNTFILPACEKFNKLGSTQLALNTCFPPDEEVAVLRTDKQEALLWVINRVARNGHPTWGLPLLVPKFNSRLNDLKEWLDAIIDPAKSLQPPRILEATLTAYIQQFGIDVESTALLSWFEGRKIAQRFTR